MTDRQKPGKPNKKLSAVFAMNNYSEINKTTWENRTETHLQSDLYNLKGFMRGEDSLPPLDYELLGDLKGKSLLHLQCHFGMDTLSIAQRDTKRTVGVDFSDSAIGKARELNSSLGLNAEFICSDIYKLPEVMNEQFDIVYTSYGIISWLEDLYGWGAIIEHYLKQGGRFVMVEFHPILWMLDEDFKEIKYAYSREEPFIETDGTYTENGEELIAQTVNWSYGLAEPITALAQNGLRIDQIQELYFSPVNLFGKMIKTGDKEYKLPGYKDKVPLLYSITASKL